MPIHRIEVRPRPDRDDVRGAAALREAEAAGVEPRPARIDAAGVYLIEAELEPGDLAALARELLADPVMEAAVVGAAPPRGDALVEVHPLPGVMDPDAEAVALAIRARLGRDVRVRTGRRYDMHGVDASAARAVAERCLANALVHDVVEGAFHPDAFPAAARYELRLVDVPLGDLDDEGLAALSRDAHLFLSLDEMRAVQAHYRALGREPRDIELETIAQTWSEHCVHKTLKATIRCAPEPGDPWLSRDALLARPGHEPGPDGTVVVRNLLRSTIAAATHELMADGVDWCLSVFEDNAGVVAFDERHAVCFKCETHNHPSALEPYGGAATGIGGCIRDIIGTGLAARPIAATDVFCVAPPERWAAPGAAPRPGQSALPPGCLHPRRILTQVVAGVRDYGNRMGIPTLNGAVWFDDDYVANPLVYCGCAGVMPRDLVHGAPRAGDRIIALGGRTGRDGIHGATFSSAELTDTHADEFSHAVQIGNPVTEKKMLDAILAARDHADGCLFRAITDCGAGGFSSAVGEMGESLGALVRLEQAPLKYEGLSPTEIWISEAQERMVLAVPPERLPALRAICATHDVELCDLGHFGTDGAELVLTYDGETVGRLSMAFLHGGLPEVEREAALARAPAPPRDASPPADLGAALLALLAHPNIASKRWIVRQYDHEVQGGSVVRPLVGPRGEGPSDAAVILPVETSRRALAIANGLATGWRDDPYLMALAAIDECVRNLACVGADPRRIAILDNFCWPGCDDPARLGALVRAAEGCYDGAKAFRAPFISGKDSLNNQFTGEDGRTIRIPPTLLISGIGILPDVGLATTMDAKRPGNLLLVVGATDAALGGSHHAMLHGPAGGTPELPVVDLEMGPLTARAVHALVERGLVRSAHDCSDGGLLVAAAEMAMAGDLGLKLDLGGLPTRDGAALDPLAACFAETPSRYLLEVAPRDLSAVRDVLLRVPFAVIGELDTSRRVRIGAALDVPLAALEAAWTGTLDW